MGREGYSSSKASCCACALVCILVLLFKRKLLFFSFL